MKKTKKKSILGMMTDEELAITTWGKTQVGRSLYRVMFYFQSTDEGGVLASLDSLKHDVEEYWKLPDKESFRDLCDHFAFGDYPLDIKLARVKQAVAVSKIVSNLCDHWEGLPADIRTDPSMDVIERLMTDVVNAFEADYGV